MYCIRRDALDTLRAMLNGIQRATVSPFAVISLVLQGQQRQQQSIQQQFQQ